MNNFEEEKIIGDQIELIQEISKDIPGFGDLFEALAVPDEQFLELKNYILVEYGNALNNSAGKRKNQLFMKILLESNPDLPERLDQVSEEVRKQLTGVVSESKIDFMDQLFDMTKKLMLEPFSEREEVDLPVELVSNESKYFAYAHSTDDGADLYAREDVLIPAAPLPMALDGNENDLPEYVTIDDKVAVNTKIVPTGVKVAIPDGYKLTIKPRSGLSAKTYLRIANSPGTVDENYLDEIGVICTNTGYIPLLIRKGDRIAQIAIEPSLKIRIAPVKSVEEIAKNRGGGFGSSGTR